MNPPSNRFGTARLVFALRLVFIITLIPLLVFIANGTVPKLRAVLLAIVIVTGVPLIVFDLTTKVRHRETQGD